MKKVIIFTHTQFSHIASSINLAKMLSQNKFKVYLYCGNYFKNFVEEQNIENDNLTIKYYKESLHSQIKLIKKDYDKYVGGIGLDREISSIKSIKKEIHEMAEFILRVSNVYKEALLDEIKYINPDLIIRDTCSLFGRMIGEALSIPVYGYATSTIVTDDCKEIDKKNFLELIYNIKLDCYGNDEINELYKYIKQDYHELSKKYNVSDIPINYLLNPGEKINFCYGMPFFDHTPKNYIYLKPTLFEKGSMEVNCHKNRNMVYVSSGSTISFPARVYNSIINCATKSLEKYVISFKYSNVDFVKIKNLPENVLIQPFVNQKEVLNTSKLFISHGGFNSLIESIYFEVPLFIIPICSDQFLNAFFVKKKGLGTSLSWHDIHNSGSINKLIESIDYSKCLRNILEVKCQINSLPDMGYLLEIIKKDLSE